MKNIRINTKNNMLEFYQNDNKVSIENIIKNYIVDKLGDVIRKCTVSAYQGCYDYEINLYTKDYKKHRKRYLIDYNVNSIKSVQSNFTDLIKTLDDNMSSYLDSVSLLGVDYDINIYDKKIITNTETDVIRQLYKDTYKVLDILGDYKNNVELLKGEVSRLKREIESIKSCKIKEVRGVEIEKSTAIDYYAEIVLLKLKVAELEKINNNIEKDIKI